MALILVAIHLVALGWEGLAGAEGLAGRVASDQSFGPCGGARSPSGQAKACSRETQARERPQC